MALEITGSDSINFGSASDIDSLDPPLTIVFWIKRVTDDFTSAFWNKGSSTFRFRDNSASVNHEVAFERIGFASQDMQAMSQLTLESSDSWVHVALVITSGYTPKIFLDGSEGSYRTQNDGVGSTPSDAASDFVFDTQEQQVAEFAWYTTELSADDIIALAAGHLPINVRPESLLRYAPLWGFDSPEHEFINQQSVTLSGAALVDHPPVLIPTPQLTFAEEVSSGISLGVDSGSYTLTGNSTGLLWDQMISIDSGSYTLTGQTASLLTGEIITAESGSYTFTGQTITTLQGYHISADSGLYTLTGQSIAFREDKIIPVEAGSYILTGQNVSLEQGYTITAESGSYTFSGDNVTLTGPATEFTLTVDSGAYTLSGQSLSLLADRKIIVDSGSYAFTGQTVSLEQGFSIQVNAGSYTLIGQSINLLETYRISRDTGIYTVTGEEVELLYSPILNTSVVNPIYRFF